MWRTKLKIAALAASLGLLTVCGGLAATRTHHHPAGRKAVAHKTRRTAPGAATLAQQVQAMRVPGDFTLVYQEVLHDFSAQAPRPPRTLVATLSARGGRLYVRKMDPLGLIGTVMVTDGADSAIVGTGSRLVGSPRATHEPGVALSSILPCPVPGLGLPHVPLVKLASATAGRVKGHWLVQGMVLRVDAGTAQLDFGPGQVEVTRQQGRLMILSAVTTGSATPDGKMDYSKPTVRWDFPKHRLFKGVWIASQMRMTYFRQGAPSFVYDFALQSASESPLGAAQFALTR